MGLIFVFLPKISRAVAQNVATAAMNIPQGVIEGVGKTVGIPVTNQTQCEKDIADGRTWDASFSCPASDFLKYVFSNKPNVQ